MNPRAWPPAVLLLVIGVALAVAACDRVPALPAVATPEPPLEGTPEVAVLFVSGDPVIARDGFDLRLQDAEGRRLRDIRIEPGERILARAGLLAGTVTVSEAGGACTADVQLVAGREVDVVVTDDGAGSCAIREAGDHELDTSEHPLWGAVSVAFGQPAGAGDLRLELRSLDTPPNPVSPPVEDEPDRPGHFTVHEVPQGAYRAQVMGDGRVLGSAEVVVGTGSASEPTITIVSAGPDPGG